jgi:general secretion pathway protein C
MPRGNDALLRQAGLQPGDVLTSVNGLSLNAEHLQEVQQQLRTGGGEARITFQRDGQSRVLTLKAP